MWVTFVHACCGWVLPQALLLLRLSAEVHIAACSLCLEQVGRLTVQIEGSSTLNTQAFCDGALWLGCWHSFVTPAE